MAHRGERTDGRMDGWEISPFYRTSSPIGAAAQKSKSLLLLLLNLTTPAEKPSSTQPPDDKGDQGGSWQTPSPHHPALPLRKCEILNNNLSVVPSGFVRCNLNRSSHISIVAQKALAM